MKKFASLMISIATLSILSACGNQAEEKLESQTPTTQTEQQPAKTQSSTYTSTKFEFSFEIPEGFSLREVAPHQDNLDFESIAPQKVKMSASQIQAILKNQAFQEIQGEGKQQNNSKEILPPEEKIPTAEFITIAKKGESEEINEYFKKNGNGDGPSGVILHEASIYVFEKPYADIIKRIDPHLEEKGPWKDIQIGNQKGKTWITSMYEKITVVDGGQYTILIHESTPELEKVNLDLEKTKEDAFLVTLEILKTLKTIKTVQQSAQTQSSTYTSQKFGFSFEIPEGFFKGEAPPYKKFPYYPSFEEANSKKEKIAPAEYTVISKTGEREEFAKEIEKLKASGVNSFDGPVFSDTSIYIFEKPYTEMIKYIDSMTQPEEKTAWKEIQIGNQKGKTLTISPYGYIKITAIDKQKHTIVIEEENCCSGKEKDFPVTPAILATLKTQ
jgi:hypothetical protein